MKYIFLSYNDAKEKIFELSLKSKNAYFRYRKDNKSNNLPWHPDKIYKNKGWINWNDFLGTQLNFNNKKEFLSFSEAKEFIHTLKLANCAQWNEYRKSENKPANIPFSPNIAYKLEGWINWNDWLGTGKIARGKEFLTFENAKKIVNILGLKTEKDWKEYCKSGKKPLNIPVHPLLVYKNKGWTFLGDWLGTGKIADKFRVYLPLNEAKKIILPLGLKTVADWQNYCRSGNKPENIPSNLYKVYKSKGWISMGDFLGTGKISNQKKIFLSFKTSRKFVHKLKLKTSREWRRYSQSGNKPDNIPFNPHIFYKNKGWISIGDWLGIEKSINVNNESKTELHV